MRLTLLQPQTRTSTLSLTLIPTPPGFAITTRIAVGTSETGCDFRDSKSHCRQNRAHPAARIVSGVLYELVVVEGLVRLRTHNRI